MAVMKSKDGNDFIVDCHCGCDEGLRIRIDKDDFESYCFMSYTSGKWYNEQETIWRILKKKLDKIWAIIRNKDYYYAEVIMNMDEFIAFKEYINSIE